MDDHEAEVLGALHIALLNALLQFEEGSIFGGPIYRFSKTLEAVLSDQREAI